MIDFMGHISINELYNELKDYLNNLGLTEQQVVVISNNNLHQDLVDRLTYLTLLLVNYKIKLI